MTWGALGDRAASAIGEAFARVSSKEGLAEGADLSALLRRRDPQPAGCGT
jgi:hypothetical protein